MSAEFIPITRPSLPPLEEYSRLLERIWETRMLSNFDEFTGKLERLAREYLGVETRAVVSGDVGLTCSIAALGIPAGAKALVPSFTFNSTVSAVLWNRLVPVFVDVDPHTWNMDPESAAREAAAEPPGLVLATHVFGNPVDSDALREVASSAGAPLLFDSAHGYGSLRDGAHVGTLGDVEVFSLSGTKPVTSAEGGLVASRDPEFLERFVFARAYGFQYDYNSRTRGMNGKMSELHAALGTLTLPRIEEVVAARAAQVERYAARLGSDARIRLQEVRPVDRSTYKDFAVLFETAGLRAAAENALVERRVQTKRYFLPCHTMDEFRRYAAGPLPVTEDVHSRILCLPIFADLTDGQIDMICETVLGSLGGGASAAG